MIDVAEDHARDADRHPIENHGFDCQIDNAAVELADDWHGKILVRTAADIDDVRNYKGHQEHRIRAMVEELEAELT